MAMAMASTANNDRFNAEAAAWDANPDVHRASDGALQALLSTYPPPSSSSNGNGNGNSSSSNNNNNSVIHLTSTAPTTDVLEIGCGTGLLSFRLAPYVRSILAIDAAEGMIAALEAKLAVAAPEIQSVITPLCILLEDAEDPRLPPAPAPAPAPSPFPFSSSGGGDDDDVTQQKSKSEHKSASANGNANASGPPRKKFDLITSHLVLHHIPPTTALPALLATMHAALRPGGEVALTDYQDTGPQARKFHPEAKMDGVESPRGIDAVAFAGLLRDAGFEDVVVAPQWTMAKEVERFPGEWGPSGQKPVGASLATMDFPFLLCRGRKKRV